MPDDSFSIFFDDDEPVTQAAGPAPAVVERGYVQFTDDIAPDPDLDDDQLQDDDEPEGGTWVL